MVWGWMPCGFAYTVLLHAALAADPWGSAATMIAFGMGTIPAMLATRLEDPRLNGSQ
jgi:sulfite exporter TauE/SafE